MDGIDLADLRDDTTAADGDAASKVRRVTIAGDVPVGIAGRRSVPVQGDASRCSSLAEVSA